MSIQKILIPTDGSEFTKKAIEYGISMAKLTGGNITTVYVMDQSIYSNMPMDSTVVNLYDMLKKEGEAALTYVIERCEQEKVEVMGILEEGMPSKTIVNMSADYDLIVMGTLGKKGMTKMLMGSVAEKVIERCQCPVMVINANINTNN